jgi:hypothetical protein
MGRAMGAMKKLLIFVLVGAAAGNVAAMFIAPMVLTWYATPAAGSALCDCVLMVRGTTNEFLRAQGIGAGSGALLFLIIGIFVWRGRAKRPPSPPTTGASSP